MAVRYVSLTLMMMCTQISLVFNLPRPANNHIELSSESSHEMSERNQESQQTQSRAQNRMAKNLIQFGGGGAPINQLYEYVPTSLQVIPLQTNYYQEASARNASVPRASRTTQLIPVYAYVPLQYNHWVPVQELAVLPISRRDGPPSQGRFRSQESEEDSRYRRVYGGHGNGWSYGGFGAGHGYHVVYHQYYK